MQAITVKYTAANSRLTARAKAGKVSLAYDHSLSEDQNAERAAYALCKKFDWVGYSLAGGTLPDGSKVFVLLNK